MAPASHPRPYGYHHNLRSRNLRTRKVQKAPTSTRATQKDAHVIDIVTDAADTGSAPHRVRIRQGGHRRRQAEAARLDPRRHGATGPSRLHRAVRPGTGDGSDVGLRHLPDLLAAAVRQLRRLPHRYRALVREVAATLRRIDHANIYLLIAGTYTPLSAALLPTRTAALVLGIVWVGAAIGTATNLLWMSAPRWFTTALYIILGWVAVWFLPQFWRTGGPAIVWLLVAGGVIYTLGAVVYARKTPDPHRAGSASTRSSTYAPWPHGSASAWPASWRCCSRRAVRSRHTATPSGRLFFLPAFLIVALDVEWAGQRRFIHLTSRSQTLNISTPLANYSVFLQTAA